MASSMPYGITSTDAARALDECDTPTPAQREKARRRLDKLVEQGRLKRLEGDKATQCRDCNYGWRKTNL